MLVHINLFMNWNIGSLQKSYSTVKFVNLSMSALGIFGTSSESLLSMLTDFAF